MSYGKQLLLVGGGGQGRETLELVRACGTEWDVRGILDDDPRLHGQAIGGVAVLGPCDAVNDYPDALVCATVASPRDPMRRLNLAARLDLPSERYATLIHPTAVVARSADLGPGCIVPAHAVLTADIRLGAHVVLGPACVLTHDDVVEDGVTFGAGVCVAGGVTIEAGAYIGAGALIREDLVIGAQALVGMGAVVTRDVPAGEICAGVPARALALV